MSALRTSPTTTKIDAAVAKAQRNVKKALKDATNPHFGSKYADLESTSDACWEAFMAEGVAIIQAPSTDGAKVTVTTRLAFEGEFYESDFTLTAAQATPQPVMACVTYARRGGLAAMTGVTPSDDDGEAAEGRKTETEKKPASRAEGVKARVAAANGHHPEPIDAYKLEALKEATAMHSGDDLAAKKWIKAVRADPEGKRAWTVEDVEKVKGALSLLRAQRNVNDEFGLEANP